MRRSLYPFNNRLFIFDSYYWRMNWRTIPALLALLAPCQTFGYIGPTPTSAPDQLCRRAIQAAERAHGIPAHLLAAIARVESGRRDPVTGGFNPWPWTINKDGQGSFYEAKVQAVAAAEVMRPTVTRSIDVGCMQISLVHHPNAFASLEQAFDPASNADYGARFLLQLFDKTSSWPKAVGLYHSATPELASDYQTKVYAALPQEEKVASMPLTMLPLASPFAPTWNRPQLPMTLTQNVPHIIPLMAGVTGSIASGRSLDSYRSMPVRMAYHLQ